jgi:hypothetical protein
MNSAVSRRIRRELEVGLQCRRFLPWFLSKTAIVMRPSRPKPRSRPAATAQKSLGGPTRAPGAAISNAGLARHQRQEAQGLGRLACRPRDAGHVGGQLRIQDSSTDTGRATRRASSARCNRATAWVAWRVDASQPEPIERIC